MLQNKSITLVFALAATVLAVTCTDGTDKTTYDAGKDQAKAQWDASFQFTGCDRVDDLLQITTDSGPTEPTCLVMGYQDQLSMSYAAAVEECDVTCAADAEQMAKEQWDAALIDIGSECAKADQVLSYTLGAAPATPQCANDAYVAKIQALYTEKFSNCIEACQGNGKQHGFRLGQQFCGVAAILLVGDPLVVAICNLEEERACKLAMKEYALDNCADEYNKRGILQ
ncbi:hypothetical protein SARC_07772 [Sphaeroforma arctica JP610]|uniref:Lipoprotein n=1 Tax=Sphaeroforma arctica JP610 TaxID=667725 RepID=A0A0L0FT33_9EUKA|nr:hypothetical protein SARC_07772 [Sphaeroforma arctica JP610]KNC79849.1 hypothetical protein SARC_07772 [Sphaeroforma arctica JP610]|eukprot:XP_014153751.1 hypothetical protein SARC_07772 [Sphaeroforma arctica JP610]